MGSYGDMMDSKIKIRAARLDDARVLLGIYKYYVENTALTFEYKVPTLEDFRGRIANILEHYPYLVAEQDGEIVGYAYAGRFRQRAAYAWNVETTIYLKHDLRRKGIGRMLYSLLEEILKVQGVVKEVALITFPSDEFSDFNSMQFHERMGYHLAGRLDYCGYKLGRWYSTISMDKIIGNPAENMCAIKDFEEVRERFGL